MKIKQIDILEIEENPKDNPGWRPVLVRIYTDENIYGDGEAALSFGLGAKAVVGMIKDLSKKLIDKNPLDIEVIWEDLYHNSFWGQNGSAVFFAALAAIDIALWDIKAKYFKVPLYVLLGGKHRNKLKTYASQLQYGWQEPRIRMTEDEDYVEGSKKAVEDGFKTLKIDFFAFDKNGNRIDYKKTSNLLDQETLKLFNNRLSKVRKSVGDGIDIIVEAHGVTDINTCRQLNKIMIENNVLFLEEPVISSVSSMKQVRDNTDILLASGERIYSKWQFLEYFKQHSINIAQPDLGSCGGITECLKICALAQAYDVAIQLHVCASPLLTAASLNVEASLSNFAIHEHHINNLQEYNRRLCKYDWQPNDGYFEIPEIIGIGNEISQYAFEVANISSIK
ncbi:MAG: mandelate racemase/muconate lactonizing enzyme family protein [Finegoldia magna]|nr:mandelate racemase/muconate lactonizing enzyme family protein [Finegoldia magna]